MDWTQAFLAALRKNGNVSEAARLAKITRRNAYARRDTDEEFKAAWDDALEEAADELENEARRRAKKGSDVLLMFLLKGLKPEKYRENKSVQISGADGGAIEIKAVDYRAVLKPLEPDADE